MLLLGCLTNWGRISFLHVVWKTWPVTWPGTCLKSSLRGNVCDCLLLSLHIFKDLLSEEALADRRDVQSIPCYSVESFILLAPRADAFWINTQNLVYRVSHCGVGSHILDPHTFIDLKLTQARVKSYEVLPSLPFICSPWRSMSVVKSFSIPFQLACLSRLIWPLD